MLSGLKISVKNLLKKQSDGGLAGMVDSREFDDDIEQFGIQMRRELDKGMEEIRKTAYEREIRLRNDLQIAIGGWVSFMKKKYGNGTPL